jgi:trans-aconitate 2-methyltransferase
LAGAAEGGPSIDPHDWDAASYEEVGAPVRAFGKALLKRLELRGDETVLDAGCGSGGVTRELIARVPHGRVIGVDGSPSMIEQARRALGDTATWMVGDLAELELDTSVDVVFSSATFHWIPDHDRLFTRLFAALRPGGRLLAQCGGQGNIAAVQAAVAIATREGPFAAHFRGWDGPWNFAGPEETVARLERAGFSDAQAGLHIEPVQPGDPREYLATMILGPHLDRLPSRLHAGFLDRVIHELPEPMTVEYVRLTMSARRPAGLEDGA